MTNEISIVGDANILGFDLLFLLLPVTIFSASNKRSLILRSVGLPGIIK